MDRGLTGMNSLLFICGAKGSYTRNDVLRSVLRGMAEEYREMVSEDETYPERLMELATRWIAARRSGETAFLGFLAQPLFPLAALLGYRDVVADFFISLYDTLCLDRGTFSPEGAVGRFLRHYDRWCLSRARLVLTDTEENADFYAATFGIERSKFLAIPVSANTTLFKPTPVPEQDRLKVFFACTFLPLHGAEIVYQAARLLGTERQIEITIVGKGQTSGRLDRELERWELPNVRRIPWIDYHRLADAVAEADICLGGHFSLNPKARRVVPGKVFQYLAMAKPVILGDGPANRRLFVDGRHAVFCQPESADDLARAIWHLAGDAGLRRQIARNGYLLFQEKFHPDAVAALLGPRLAAPRQD